MAVVEAIKTTSKEGCNRGVWLGLEMVWPPAVDCDHYRIVAAKEDRGVAAGEGAGIVDAAKEEVASDYDEESITKRKERKCFSLFRARIPSWE